jgi:hypothetical protein
VLASGLPVSGPLLPSAVASPAPIARRPDESFVPPHDAIDATTMVAEDRAFKERTTKVETFFTSGT